MVRWTLRLLFFLVAAFGVLIGVIYPIAAQNQDGYEIGKWRVFSAGQGFLPAEMHLPADEEKIGVRVEIGTSRIVATGGEVVLTMTAASDGRTRTAQTFTLENAEHRDGLPSLPIQYYTVAGEPLRFIGDEPYVFVFGPGEVELPLVFVDLVLVGGLFDYDESVPPIGFGMMGIGFLGLVLTFRKRREKTGPPPPKWGRS